MSEYLRYVLDGGLFIAAYCLGANAAAIDDAFLDGVAAVRAWPGRLTHWVDARWARLLTDLDERLRSYVLESERSFGAWWRETEVNRRRRLHVGRHARARLYDTDEWRIRWASFQTQAWPTSATTGNAWDVVPGLRPMICTRDLWTIQSKPTICVRDLRIHSLAHIG